MVLCAFTATFQSYGIALTLISCSLSGWREGDRVKAALEGSWASLRRELP